MRPFSTHAVVIAVSAALAIAPNAWGQERTIQNAIECWNILPPSLQAPAKVEITATLAAGRVTDISVDRYEPDNDAGYATAQSAVRALDLCGHYGDQTGAFAITFDTEAEQPGTSVSIPLPGKQ